MIRFVCTLLAVLGLFFDAEAQQLPSPHGCGYDHYVHFLDQAYPGFKQSADAVFQRNTNTVSSRDEEILTIPVVVHIVWQEEDQNLADSLVEQVIDVLNEDYRRLNADADLIRSEFAEVVGDPFIEFELVAVERVQTEATFELNLLGGSLPDNVKVAAEGGSDAWDTEHYLNIWVCNIEGGALLGYAYPPADLDHWPAGANAPSPELDGVVIHAPVFRRTGTFTASGLIGNGETTIPVRGRAVTHEVAHYLGLRHIWGDGLLSILGIPDCDADDGVADTPQQGMSSQFQCDMNQNTCEEEMPDDLPDMFENFMDYASDDCMNSFTVQQIAIMRSVLENERSGLLSPTVNNEEVVIDQNQFLVYPNPARDQLFVEVGDFLTEKVQLQVIDTQGRVVKAIILQSDGPNSIDVANLLSGLYTLLLTSNQQQFLQRVVIR